MIGRLVVLASGTGTNLGALIDAIAEGRLNAEIVLVVINRKAAKARLRAEQAGIPVQYWPLSPYRKRFQALTSSAGGGVQDVGRSQSVSTTGVLLTSNTEGGVQASAGGWVQDVSRQRYDADLAEAVASMEPDLIVLAGWMYLLSPTFLDCFSNKVINLHPALPGEFPGSSAIADAWAAFNAKQIIRTGVMTHYVPDAGVDSGPVIASVEVPIHHDDTLESLSQRIHAVEHKLIVSTVAQLLAQMFE